MPKSHRPTLIALLVGLWLFGTGEALLVDARLGVTPWTVLAEGLSARLPISIGEATFATSVAVLLVWIPLRERPGLGTVANAVVIAISLQVMSDLLPEPSALVPRALMVTGGIALIGLFLTIAGLLTLAGVYLARPEPVEAPVPEPLIP